MIDEVIIPEPLQEGDLIAIVSPSGRVKTEFVEKAATLLRDYGWEVEIKPHALGHYGSFSGTPRDRLTDLKEALLDPKVKAIICSRGGYGAIHLLDDLDKVDIRENAKWIVGYSDISALHALMAKHGVASIHAPMTKHLSTFNGDDIYSQALFDILKGSPMSHTFAASPLNRPGKAKGRLLGGNLAVIMGLFDTPYNVVLPDTILFIEDIAEPVYKIERQLYQLKFNGVLSKLKGLIVGQFTEVNRDLNGENVEEMIARMVSPYSYPVAFNAPIGHVDANLPIVESSEIVLDVTPDEVKIIEER